MSISYLSFVKFCIAAGLFIASSANADTVRDCEKVVQPKPVLSGQGALEAIAFNDQGTLFLSNYGNNNVSTVANRNAEPVVLVETDKPPGGLAFGDEGELYVGVGNGPGGIAPSLGNASILRIDPATGASEQYAEGLGMANGVVRGEDGTLYASNDFARSLDRVLPGGTVETGWLKLNSNGMVLSQDGQTLYVNRSIFSRVFAVNLSTGKVRPYSKYNASLGSAFFDGLTIDKQGQLYVAAYFRGEILKVDTNGKVCILAKGMPLVSAAAFGVNPQGSETGFASNSLFVTSHNGILYELVDVIE